MKRTLWVLVAILLLASAIVGCSPDSPDTTGSPDAGETTSSDSDSGTTADTGLEAAESDEPAALAPETDGEKTAAAHAETEESRKWASGDPQNGTPVAGDPMFVGYGVLVHDGAKQYQVMVIDGAVTGFFGKSADPRYIEAPFQDYNPTIDPASARQSEAFEAAKAEIAAINPNATQGGIEFYVFFYPSVEEASYPQACIYAEPALAEFPMAIGGSFGWR